MSFTTHASVTAVARVITGTPPDLIVGIPNQLAESAGPYGLTVGLILNILFVASRVFNNPPEPAIIAALNTR